MEQKRTISFINNLYMTGYELPASEKIFLAQSKAIQKVAEEPLRDSGQVRRLCIKR